MATLEGIFGPISGRLGDCVFRNKWGKTIIAALPRKRTSPKNASEIENEKKIGVTGKIAKSIAGNRHYVLIGVQVTSYYTISF